MNKDCEYTEHLKILEEISEFVEFTKQYLKDDTIKNKANDDDLDSLIKINEEIKLIALGKLISRTF